jgi:hypothetical protein
VRHYQHHDVDRVLLGELDDLQLREQQIGEGQDTAAAPVSLL